jgi:TonB family protein
MQNRSLLLVGLGLMLASAVVAGPRVIRQTKPVYPLEAKQAGITGVVVLDAMIAPDGAVRGVRVVSGPPVLADEAVKAVSQWVYEPVTVDGRPVAAHTRVTLTFGVAGAVAIEDSVGGVNGLRPIEMARPAYPPQAKAERISGVVRLRATVGEDGAIHSLAAVSGPAILVEAALEAVRQWKYTPVSMGGKPVEAIVDIDVNFTLTE